MSGDLPTNKFIVPLHILLNGMNGTDARKRTLEVLDTGLVGDDAAHASQEKLGVRVRLLGSTMLAGSQSLEILGKLPYFILKLDIGFRQALQSLLKGSVLSRKLCNTSAMDSR